MWNENKFRKNIEERVRRIDEEMLKHECEDLYSNVNKNSEKIAKLKEEKDALEYYLKSGH